MKLNLRLKNKEVSIESDVERIVEKGMDNHEKDWKSKFIVKQEAKKEMQKLKHSQKVELEKVKQNKKNWLQKRTEEKIKLKEIEMAEQRRKEKQQRVNTILAVSFLMILIIFCIIMGIIEG